MAEQIKRIAPRLSWLMYVMCAAIDWRYLSFEAAKKGIINEFKNLNFMWLELLGKRTAVDDS